jgi:tetratricopeptide (TPR) repeat protein
MTPKPFTEKCIRMSITIERLNRYGLVCLLTGFVLLPACQIETVRPSASHSASYRPIQKTGKNPYAQVLPEVLDPSLTKLDLDRIFLPLDRISSDLDFLSDDPNFQELVIQPPPSPCLDDGRKVYLRGRWLLAKGKVTEAIRELDRALSCDPNSVELMELLSRANRRDGQLHRAETLSRAALHLAPDRILSYQTLGDIYFAQQRFSKAVALYRVGLRHHLANRDNALTVMMQLNQATALMAQGYYQAGLTSYQEAYRLLKRQRQYNHANAAMGQLAGQAHLVLVAMAGLHLQIGEISKAVDLLDETLEVLGDVDLVKLFVNSLATQRVSLSLRYRRVVAFCEYLLAVNYSPESTITNFYRACEKMSRLGDFTQRLGLWTQPAQGFRPLLDQRTYAYGLSLVEEYSQAEAVLLEALSSDSKSVPLYRELARLYRTWQRWTDMIEACSRLLNYSESSNVSGEMEWITESIGQIDQPSEVLEQWQRRGDFIPDASGYYLSGQLAQASGDEEQSEHFYRLGVSLNKQFYMSRQALCDLLLRQERYVDVLKLIENLNGHSVTDSKCLSYAGQAHSGLKQYDQAEAVYRRALLENKDASSGQIVLYLGDVLVRRGDYEQAELIFLDALDQSRDDQTIYPHLLGLYGGWNAQENLPPKLKEDTGSQLRKIFRQWLEVERDQDRAALADLGTQTQALEDLVQRYSQSRILHLLLSKLYAHQNRFEEAIAQLQPFLQADETDEELLELSGEYYVRSSDYAQAAEVYQALWKLSPDNPQRFLKVLTGLRLSNQADCGLDLLLADETQLLREKPEAIDLFQDESYRSFGITRRFDEAAVLYRQWLEEVEATGEPLSESGQKSALRVSVKLIWALEQTQNYDEAIERTRFLIEAYQPKDLRPVARLVRLLNVQRRFDESLELLSFLQELYPDKLLVLHQTAMIQVLAGQADQAIEKVNSWYLEQPDDPQRRQLLLTLLQRCQKLSEAIEYLQQWQEKSPSKNLAYHQFELLIESGQFEKAGELLDDSQLLKNDEGVIFEARIKLMTEQGKCPEALALVDTIIRDQKSAMALQLKSQILASCGNYEQAIELIELAIEVGGPQLVDYQLQYSLYLETAGRIDDALAVLEELLAENPELGSIQNNLGYLLVNHDRDLERAANLLESAYRSNPDSGATLDSLGWLHYKRGEFEMALRYLYQSTAAIFQIDAEIWDHLGDTAYQLGKQALAKYYWQQAVNHLIRRPPSRQECDFKDRVINKLEQLQLNQEVTVAEVLGLEKATP